MGIPPSAVSSQPLAYPIQEVVHPLALRLRRTSQALRQVCQHVRTGLIVSCRSRPRSMLFGPSPQPIAWPNALAPLRLRCTIVFDCRHNPAASDRRRIPLDVLDKMAIHRPRNQRLMPTAGQTALGKLGKGPRKRRFARKPAGTAPAAQPA